MTSDHTTKKNGRGGLRMLGKRCLEKTGLFETHEELLQVGNHFCEMAQTLGTCSKSVSQPAAALTRKKSSVMLAKCLLKERRARGRIFSASLFGEPAWDMLLDLYISQSEGKKLDVTAVTLGSGSPPTTALRWLQVLKERSLIVRTEDACDRRRYFIELSDEGRNLLQQYLDQIRSERSASLKH